MAEMTSPLPGGDVTRAPLLDGVDWSMTGLTLIFVVCRLFSRYRIIRKPGLDDFVVTISIVSKFAEQITLIRHPHSLTWFFRRS